MTAECWSRADGTLAPMPVNAQAPAPLLAVGLNRPPVFVRVPLTSPPQTIISPVAADQTAVCPVRAEGTGAVVVVGIQESPVGEYLPPVIEPPVPPQTITSLPDQTAVAPDLAEGHPAPIDVGRHESVAGV